jgi:hypothetical protein
MKETDRAWAGGLFEGEGCWTLNKGRPIATLRMSDEDSVRRFHTILGVGYVYEHQPSKTRSQHKHMWIWQVSTMTDFIVVATALAPHMGNRRSQRLLEVWSYIPEPIAQGYPRNRGQHWARFDN